MSLPTNPEVQELLAQHPSEVADIASALRQRVFALVGDTEEEVYFDWNQVGFACGAGMKRQFCAIAVRDQRVDLIFNRGAELDDPTGLLEGAGKKERHVPIASPQALNNPAIDALIRSAADLAASDS